MPHAAAKAAERRLQTGAALLLAAVAFGLIFLRHNGWHVWGWHVW